MADLRDKRDSLQRQLYELVEDAERKRQVYEGAVAKATAQKLEVDEVEKQVEIARARFQLPSPLRTPSFAYW